jgi:hypothetical protein
MANDLFGNAWDIAKALFSVTAKGAKLGAQVGYSAYKNSEMQTKQEKIKEAAKWLRKAENGDFVLREKAYECYQDEEFDDAIFYAKQAVEKGERERWQMFGD